MNDKIEAKSYLYYKKGILTTSALSSFSRTFTYTMLPTLDFSVGTYAIAIAFLRLGDIVPDVT